jgi:predicted AlkP superfamily pyrophosphatase or phosphodiesterase
MREPGTDRQFSLSNRDAIGDGRWWLGEPLWVTAQRQGRRAATLFWPGSEAPIEGMRPDEWAPYDERMPNHERIVRILRWLDLPPARRPALITGYFNDADDAGHEAGPDSWAVRQAILTLDAVVGELVGAIEARGLTDRVNLVIVSDHGMASTSPDRIIPIGDYLNPADVDVIDIDSHLGLNLRTGSTDELYRRLSHAHRRLRVYRRDETPTAWRYRDQPRIPAIVGVADEGWTIVRSGKGIPFVGEARGNHGFDPSLRSMHGMLIAAGPAFRRGVVAPPFQNIHIYNMLAAAMRVRPAPNDGDPAVAAQLLNS